MEEKVVKLQKTSTTKKHETAKLGEGPLGDVPLTSGWPSSGGKTSIRVVQKAERGTGRSKW